MDYHEILIKKVIDYSKSNYWNEAVEEWEIVDMEDDLDQTKSCICGKESLRFLYTIKNRYTGITLYPIAYSEKIEPALPIQRATNFHIIANGKTSCFYPR